MRILNQVGSGMGVAITMPLHRTAAAADTLTVASAATYGVTWLAEVDTIISIIAGVLVAISAGFSIYLHLRGLRGGHDHSHDDS
jgi:hypothetical protein